MFAMKKIVIPAVLAACALGASMAPAGATALYENINYGGYKFDAPASNNLGLMNDKASSVSTAGNRTKYWADAGYRGASFTSAHGYNNLKNTEFGNWNDRISSYKHTNL